VEKAIIRILQNPYWTRLWVLQEINLGRDTLVCQGKKAVSWGRFTDAIMWRMDLGFEVPFIMVNRAESFVSSTLDWRKAARFAARLQCQDVRDKVFGQLGLVHNCLRFHPDYSTTCQDLLLMMLRKTLEYYQPVW
jgi:hypothetical protein